LHCNQANTKPPQFQIFILFILKILFILSPLLSHRDGGKGVRQPFEQRICCLGAIYARGDARSVKHCSLAAPHTQRRFDDAVPNSRGSVKGSKEISASSDEKK